MIPSPIAHLVVLAALVASSVTTAFAASPLAERAARAIALFEGAEDRFTPPDPEWFEQTRVLLTEETERVGDALESHGTDYAAAWKNHLRWPLLASNLGEASSIDVDDLALVRRWLYSNREGLEYPFFAQLRERVDAHLDAAVAFTHADLEAAFRQNVRLVRQQLQVLSVEPNDEHAAALGRTLGWFAQTRQLDEEVAAARELVSLPNAQIVVAKPLIDRALSLLATDVEQTLPVTDRVTVPNASLFGRSRTVNIHGEASTTGAVSLKLLENKTLADLLLVYRGDIDSHCSTVVGPVTVAMRTLGPVTAITPVQVSFAGVNLVTTKVEPQVSTRVTNVSARSEVFRRIGKRRISEPESKQQMNSRASYKAAKLLQEQMDERVRTVIDEIRAELEAARSSFDNVGDVLAPVVREGATPRWAGIQSSSSDITVSGMSQRREQLGAPTYAPAPENPADIHIRLHVSFFNNMLETIMAGKTFTDRYFMRYSRIVQAELPPALMVHARSVRWSVDATKPRPLEISIPAPNRFLIQLRFQKVAIGEEEFTGQTNLTVTYDLVENEYGEYHLQRDGEVLLDSPLPNEQATFLHAKMSAFFAPVLDGSGVALPEGGSVGRLRGLQPQGAHAENNWLTVGINMPDDFLKEWLPVSEDVDDR